MMMEMMQKIFLEETGNVIGGYLNNADKPLSGSDKKLQDSYEEFVHEATNPTGNTMTKLKNLALALCTVCLKFDHETEEDIDKLNEYQKNIILFTGKVVETLTIVEEITGNDMDGELPNEESQKSEDIIDMIGNIIKKYLDSKDNFNNDEMILANSYEKIIDTLKKKDISDENFRKTLALLENLMLKVINNIFDIPSDLTEEEQDMIRMRNAIVESLLLYNK